MAQIVDSDALQIRVFADFRPRIFQVAQVLSEAASPWPEN